MPPKNETGGLEPLLSALHELVRWLVQQHVQYTFIGGIAASVIGRPRTTRDIDILVALEEREWTSFLYSAEQYGFSSRIHDCLKFAHELRVMPMRHQMSGVDVDVVMAGLPFEMDTISNASPIDVMGVQAMLPRAEDLIIMKAVAHRPRDIADIESLIDRCQNLDWKYVLTRANEFAAALDASDIVRTLQQIWNAKRG